MCSSFLVYTCPRTWVCRYVSSLLVCTRLAADGIITIESAFPHHFIFGVCPKLALRDRPLKGLAAETVVSKRRPSVPEHLDQEKETPSSVTERCGRLPGYGAISSRCLLLNDSIHRLKCKPRILQLKGSYYPRHHFDII